MTGAHISIASSSGDNRRWAVAGAAALIAHGAAVAAITALAVPAEDAAEAQPVMIVELPPEGVESSAASIPAAARQQPQQARSATRPSRPPPADPAPLATPAPTRPAPPVMPARLLVPVAARPAIEAVAAPAIAAAGPAATPAPSPAPAPAPAARGGPDSPGDNPRARAAEADYFSLLSAHLNRRKTYPAEAKQALQQGIVTVRFTVARDGSVSGASIRKGSGHALLDRATLDLVQRVAPLPRFPRGMARDSVTISLPIEYSLRTD